MSNSVLKRKSKIAVGMSGGVDSSIVAYLLKQEGHEVCGITMQIWDGSLPLKDEGWSGCYGPGEARDIESAAAVCERLGIKHHIVSLASEYRTQVLEYFRSEYLRGRTPNPCVRCNQNVKFGFLLERAGVQGVDFEYFATGHYARVSYDSKSARFLLRRGLDSAKDQSYFLSFLRQEQLQRVLFPLGELAKEQVKALAREIGWEDLAAKRESQDFIEAKNYSVLFKPEDVKPGPIVTERGERIGTHQGIINYTVGQRKGLLGGAAEPMYVVAVDGQSNTVKVGSNSALMAARLRAEQLNWIPFLVPTIPLPIQAKIRQQHQAAPATVAEVLENGSAWIEFSEPQRAITPGQVAVMYQGDLVLGGGIIVE